MGEPIKNFKDYEEEYHPTFQNHDKMGKVIVALLNLGYSKIIKVGENFTLYTFDMGHGITVTVKNNFDFDHYDRTENEVTIEEVE